MDSDLRFEILAALATALAPFLVQAARLAWTWLREKIRATRLAPVMGMVDLFVRQAQQQFDPVWRKVHGKAWVIAQVKRRYPKVDARLLEAFVEASVLEIKREFGDVADTDADAGRVPSG